MTTRELTLLCQMLKEKETLAYESPTDVVRCKDCAIRYSACPMAVRFPTEDKMMLVRFITEDEDYCSKGVRMRKVEK